MTKEVSTVKKKAVKKSTTKKASEKKKAVKKKTAKKKAVKKASPKVEKEKARKTVKKNASPDKVFILVNGKKVKNIKELADVIERIEDHVFNHHVNENKHDFAVWLKDVFEEVGLAEELAHVKDKKHVQLVLYKHISHKLW